VEEHDRRDTKRVMVGYDHTQEFVFDFYAALGILGTESRISVLHARTCARAIG